MAMGKCGWILAILSCLFCSGVVCFLFLGTSFIVGFLALFAVNEITCSDSQLEMIKDCEPMRIRLYNETQDFEPSFGNTREITHLIKMCNETLECSKKSTCVSTRIQYTHFDVDNCGIFRFLDNEFGECANLLKKKAAAFKTPCLDFLFSDRKSCDKWAEHQGCIVNEIGAVCLHEVKEKYKMMGRYGNVFLCVICCFCTVLALVVLVIGVIYMSLFILVNDGSTCGKAELIKGKECAPKIEALSDAVVNMKPGYANPDRFRQISHMCDETLQCVEPIRCKSITQDFKYVKTSCVLFHFAAYEFHECLKRLQTRYEIEKVECLEPLIAEDGDENEKVCAHLENNHDCIMTEIQEHCDNGKEKAYETPTAVICTVLNHNPKFGITPITAFQNMRSQCERDAEKQKVTVESR